MPYGCTYHNYAKDQSIRGFVIITKYCIFGAKQFFFEMITTKRALLTATLLIVCVTGLFAQTRQTRQEYVNRYKHIAVEHMLQYGIPASITMAQGILESDSGNSTLSRKSNNHFGIKCKSNWSGASVTHDDDEKGECFRAYSTVEQSYRDHAIFLDSSPRYDSLFDLSSSDYKSWARGLKKAGYATAHDYAQRLIKIIEDNGLYILDQEGGVDKYVAQYGGTTAIPTQIAESATGALSVDNFEVTINGHKGYGVFRRNGVFFVFANKGDSYKTIAKFFDISERRLRGYNEVPRRSTIKEGDVVYIARKESKWKEDKNTTHTVKSGETIHSVSQEYAITAKALIKINKTDIKYSLREGQILKLK